MVGGDALGDLFEEDGFTGLWWSYDEGALSASDGRDEVDDSGGE